MSFSDGSVIPSFQLSSPLNSTHPESLIVFLEYIIAIHKIL